MKRQNRQGAYRAAVFVGALLAGVVSGPVWADEPPSVVSLEASWDELLSRFRTRDGLVRYEAWRADADALRQLDSLVESIASPSFVGASRNEQLASLVNAYNVLVIREVLRRWPTSNVLEENGFFDGVVHRVGGRDVTLNQLEHEWIRPTFQEPRVHFVLNCASRGCPPLPSRALRASELERTLDTATRTFVRANTRVDGDAVRVSQLFEWFAEDFGGPEGVRPFVARYLEGETARTVSEESRTIVFDPYDWAINAR